MTTTTSTTTENTATKTLVEHTVIRTEKVAWFCTVELPEDATEEEIFEAADDSGEWEEGKSWQLGKEIG